MNIRFSSIIWGIFLLLGAIFLLVNQFDSFAEISTGGIIVAILALAIIVQCIAHLYITPLPIPLAVLYIIFQTPLDLPAMQTRILIIASILASIGLAILLPRKSKYKKFKYKNYSEANHQQIRTKNTNNDNNPFIKVNFGAKSRRLLADSLETVKLSCHFGALEVYFDQAVLSLNGAVINLDCNFGATTLYIPKTWRVIEQLNCSLGGVDMEKRSETPAEDAPQLTLTGNISFGGVEVRFI